MLYVAVENGLGSLNEVLDLTPAQVERVLAAGGRLTERRAARDAPGGSAGDLMTRVGPGARVL